MSESLPQLALTPPEPVSIVSPEQVQNSGQARISSDEQQALDARVKEFVTDLLSAPIEGEAFRSRADSILHLADREIEASANVSGRLLQRPLRSGGQTAGQQQISSGLLELRDVCEQLDPKNQSLFAPAKLLGLIPFGNKIKTYFRSYQTAQTHLNAIMDSLLSGKDELLRDNASIEQERSEMWRLIGKLDQAVYLCKTIDAEISAQIDAIESRDPERAKQLRENALFYARQKVEDLLTQLAVNIQGYLALDLIKKNNVELIKGVDRARTTTLAALRTAVIVASALGNQKLVLDKINALKETTGTMIASTGEMLRVQSAQIFAQASDPTIDVAKLQAAFDNIYATIAAVDTYKTQALAAMSQTADALTSQVERAKRVLGREPHPDA
jgi:uncharacterized protein YaaN involved in tellurite resistance